MRLCRSAESSVESFNNFLHQIVQEWFICREEYDLGVC